jgi:dCMP deaminase
MKKEDKLMFIGFAEVAAQRSHAIRRKVGCVLVKDGEVLSTGLNGMPPKWPTEECENKVYAKDEKPWLFDGSQLIDQSTHKWLHESYPNFDVNGIYKLVTKPECRHAEVAALEKVWKSHDTTEGAECFVTTSPCKNCSIKLFTAGIKKVYYKEEYRSNDGIEYLLANNVEVEKL